jgi:hypothetical protein
VEKLEALHERFLTFAFQHIEGFDPKHPFGKPTLAQPLPDIAPLVPEANFAGFSAGSAATEPVASPDKIKADIARLTDELAAAVQAEDYAKADPLKRELDGLKSMLKDLPASTAPAKAAPAAPAFGGFGAPAAPTAGGGIAFSAPAPPAGGGFGGPLYFGAPAPEAAPLVFPGFNGDPLAAPPAAPEAAAPSQSGRRRLTARKTKR